MTIFGIEISDKIYLPIFIILGAYVLDMIINKILSLRIVINKNLTKHEQRSRETGILKQCVHDGFGLIRFGERLTGPEYSGRFIIPILR